MILSFRLMSFQADSVSDIGTFDKINPDFAVVVI